MIHRFVSAVAICALTLSACASPAEQKTIDGLVQHFTASGLDVGERSEKFYSLIGAENGFGVEIGGEEVEVYQFNLSITSGREMLETLQRDGFMGGAVQVQDNLVMFESKQHPQWSEILTAFQSY